MLLPSQHLYPGKLAGAWRRELNELVASDAVNRLWAKDETLWRGAGGQKRLVGENLAWLDLPERIGKYMAKPGELAPVAQSEGFQDVVLIGMGGPNLAAETLLNTSRKSATGVSSSWTASIRAPFEQWMHSWTMPRRCLLSPNFLYGRSPESD